jgi:hypothetical protein
MEAMKAMIHDQDLPMHLWAEVSRTVVHVRNRSPHKVLEKKTPEEMFIGEKPEVIHLRIFGCPVYVHVPKDKRSKLDPSGKKGTFVGYSETYEQIVDMLTKPLLRVKFVYFIDKLGVVQKDLPSKRE